MNYMEQKNPISAVLIGAGARGRGAYGAWAVRHPERLKVIAVAEPHDARREAFAREHRIDPENQFRSWEELLARERMADACLICTQDQMHTAPALQALQRGYDVLLEKPMATVAKECRELVQVAEGAGRELRICHVARYAQFFSRAKRAILDGRIGDIIHINHAENVAFWHFAHGYVRGNWRKAEDSSPVILAKTCHDFDLIYWMVEEPARQVHSFGELTFFREENAPAGAPARCTDGCPAASSCLFYAPRLYVTADTLLRITARAKNPLMRLIGNTAINHPKIISSLSCFYRPLRRLVDWDMWPATVITDTCTLEEKWDAMCEGPYGRCVFRCDNDVPDHQSVNIVFENGVTATLTMQGHSFLDGRWMRIDGTRGTLMGEFTYAGERLVYYDHRTLAEHLLWEQGISFSAHGGGDEGLMDSFVERLQRKRSGQNDREPLTSARESLESHLMAFAAEQSRLESRVIPMGEMR